MIRVVLDTNVLVSAVRADRGPLAVIREGWLSGLFQVYVSGPFLTEVEHTLTKPYFAERLGQERIRRFVTLLKRTAVLQPIIDPVWGGEHAEDNWILTTGKSAHTQSLVTGTRRCEP